MPSIIKRTQTLRLPDAPPPAAEPAVVGLPARAAPDLAHPRPASPPAGSPSPAGPPPEEVLRQVKLEAEAIRTAALAEAALLREQAMHEGYEAGLAEGRAAAAQVVDTSVERLRALASSARSDRAAMIRDLERQVLDLALAVARAVIRREVALDPSVIAHTLDALLTQLQSEVVTTLRVHPDDAPLLTRLWSERARSAADRQAQIVADHRIARGGCRVETRTGAWDATLGTQLEVIQQALAGARGEGG